MDNSEFIGGTRRAHEYLVDLMGPLAPSWETFRCATSASWRAKRQSRVPKGYPVARKVPGIKSAVFLRKELLAYAKAVFEKADPECLTSSHKHLRALIEGETARTRAQSAAQAR
ncbi:MAG: hypothetical protein OXH76_18690 [Boseongicola sp.]|nr:hypothetical protein [Boseongicola sp.]